MNIKYIDEWSSLIFPWFEKSHSGEHAVPSDPSYYESHKKILFSILKQLCTNFDYNNEYMISDCNVYPLLNQLPNQMLLGLTSEE